MTRASHEIKINEADSTERFSLMKLSSRGPVNFPIAMKSLVTLNWICLLMLLTVLAGLSGS